MFVMQLQAALVLVKALFHHELESRCISKIIMIALFPAHTLNALLTGGVLVSACFPNLNWL